MGRLVVKAPSKGLREARASLQAVYDDMKVNDNVLPFVESMTYKAWLALTQGESGTCRTYLRRAWRKAQDPWKQRIKEVLILL